MRDFQSIFLIAGNIEEDFEICINLANICLGVDVLKTSSRSFWKTFCKHVLRASWRQKTVTLKTSWRRLGKQEMSAGKWHLSALLFIRLSLSHLNNLVEVSSKDLTSFILFALTYDVLSSAWLAISRSSLIKNKLIKKILNSKGPRIEPFGTPKTITC